MFVVACTVAGHRAYSADQNPAAGSGQPPRHWYPEDLWHGIDVEKMPLELQVTKRWEENGCAYEKLTYVSEVADGVKIRIFGLLGAPKGANNVPGILHIHGGGQTASLAWVQYWVKRRYACVTYDFCGKWENRTEYTDWGPLAKNCNMAANGVYQVHPTPRISGWFHWALAGRRALTLLAQNPAVDPNRLGIFGISVGGTLCWLVAGADARVKAAIPIYGCGYNVDRRKTVYGLVPGEDQLIYQEALAPEAYAPYIQCPVFFLSASNDHHGWMDDSFDALGAVPATTRQTFTPHYIHHIEPEQGADLQPWMDWHLKGGKPFPETPGLELKLDNRGVLEGRVRPQKAETVSKVILYYALGMKIPPSRFWRRVEAEKTEDGNWSASLPVVSVWDRASVFANVFYDSGICLSTKLSQVLPGQLGKARATLTPRLAIDDCSAGYESWFFGPAYTDPNSDSTLLSTGEDEGRRYVSVNKAGFGDKINFTIASHIFGDPQFQGPPSATLAFDCKGGFDTNGLTLSLSEGEWMPGGINYTAKVAQQEVVGGWKTVLVPLSKFINEKGANPGSWSKTDRIQVSGVATQSEPPLFSHFRWIMP
jgi:dienelactone hydrolase